MCIIADSLGIDSQCIKCKPVIDSIIVSTYIYSPCMRRSDWAYSFCLMTRHNLVQDSSHNTASSFQDCTYVRLQQRSLTSHSLGQTSQLARPDLEKTTTPSCLCGCHKKMTQSVRWAPSDIRVVPSFHQLATRSLSWLSYTVCRVHRITCLFGRVLCIVWTEKLDCTGIAYS